MAARHSTPSKRRSLSTRKPPPARRFVQRIAWDVIEIEECLRDVRRYFQRLEQAARASQRLGNRVYGQIRAEEKRR